MVAAHILQCIICLAEALPGHVSLCILAVTTELRLAESSQQHFSNFSSFVCARARQHTATSALHVLPMEAACNYISPNPAACHAWDCVPAKYAGMTVSRVP